MHDATTPFDADQYLLDELDHPNPDRQRIARRCIAELEYLAYLRADCDGIPLARARRELLDEDVLRDEFYGADDERSETAFRLWDCLSQLDALKATARVITHDERLKARQLTTYVRRYMERERVHRRTAQSLPTPLPGLREHAA